MGKEDGTFHAAVLYSIGGGYTWGVTVADFNGDGKLDIVNANFYQIQYQY
ncbi:MAG: FG-GAP repeat domain-containing protein [Candidatus Midichloria sp.]